MAEEFLDEVILKARQEKKKKDLKQYISRRDMLSDEFFQTIRIEKGMAQMKVPIGLKPMPEEMVNKKFQFDPQPQTILTNSNGTVNFTISALDMAIPGEMLPMYLEESMKGLRRYLASIVFYEKGQEQINGMNVCWFAYMSNSQDGCKLYNIVFYAAAEKTLVVTMNCKYEQMEKWDAVARICIKTLTGKECNG